MQRKLTQDKIEKYVKSGGNHCPWCGSDNVRREYPNFRQPHVPGSLSQGAECRNSECGATWTEIFTLTMLAGSGLLPRENRSIGP